MPITARLVTGAIALAAVSAGSVSVSTTTLITAADHDTARSLAVAGLVLGVIIPAVGAATAAVCFVIARRFADVEGRIDRVEQATARVAEVDHDILRAVHRTLN